MMRKLLIITTEEDRSEQLLIHEKLRINIEHYSSELLTRANELTGYDYIYFRDPFNIEQYNLGNLGEIFNAVRENNPNAYYFDNANKLEDMLVEDKWRQAELFGSLMPHTELVDNFSEINFNKQFVKKRISSRARGVVFNDKGFEKSAKPNNYIIQEKLDIAEEYRVIAVRGVLLDDVAVKSCKTSTQKVKVTGTINLTDEIRKFATSAISKTPDLDFIGLDIARLNDGGLKLIEINRSPQFISFVKFVGDNPFKLLVEKLLAN